MLYKQSLKYNIENEKYSLVTVGERMRTEIGAKIISDVSVVESCLRKPKPSVEHKIELKI